MSEQLTPPGIELYLSTEPSKLLIRDHTYLPFRSINPNLPDLGSTFFFLPLSLSSPLSCSILAPQRRFYWSLRWRSCLAVGLDIDLPEAMAAPTSLCLPRIAQIRGETSIPVDSPSFNIRAPPVTVRPIQRSLLNGPPAQIAHPHHHKNPHLPHRDKPKGNLVDLICRPFGDPD